MSLRMQVESLWTTSAERSFEFEFAQDRVVIGRSGSADVQLPHPAISQVHATIEARGARHTITDEGSTNGTRVNGERVAPGRPKPLRDGDVVSVGGFRVTVSLHATGAPARSERTAAVAREIVRALLDEYDEASAASLTVLHGASSGTTHPLPAPPASVVIGRAPECDINIEDAKASREHARVSADLDGFVIEDLASKNPVLINAKARRRHRLSDRDEIKIGSTIFVYEDPTGRKLEELTRQQDAPIDILPVRESSAPATKPAPQRQNRADSRSWLRADMMVYVLAAALTVASLAVLLWLLRTE